MIQAVIFDMDGTIFDTERLLLRAWQELVRQGLIPEKVLELLPSWRGMNRREICKRLTELAGGSFSPEPFYAKRRAIMGELLDQEGVPLKPGVPNIFEQLREMGYSMALATATSRESVEDYMNRTGYGSYFDSIVTGDRVDRCKPAPDIFLLAARELGIAPEHCVVVEDSINGVLAGSAAGMRVIMVPDMDQPDESLRSHLWHCCDTLAQIPNLLAQTRIDQEE